MHDEGTLPHTFVETTMVSVALAVDGTSEKPLGDVAQAESTVPSLTVRIGTSWGSQVPVRGDAQRGPCSTSEFIE